VTTTTGTARGRTNGRATPVKAVRAAAYARISVADRDATPFSSVQAQVEAITAYVRSQKAEGWTLVGEPYVDDGFSGATTDRPALERLLQDTAQGGIDVVVVHRFDRFSRSQRDFLNLLHALEERGVAFASVSQQLDTSTPMGRCMLSVITAFAQMEREVIAERTRDKVRAARRKGLWTGGRPVLGYDVVDKRLVVNEDEAERVRAIFELYLGLGSLLAVIDELRRRGWTTKTWTNQKGETVRGRAFTKTSLYGLLTNPLYLGKLRAGDELVDGAHEAIVDEDTWHVVQARLREHGAGRASGGRRRHDALLGGLAYCACGSALTPHHTTRGDRRYAYYVCSRAQKEGADACPGSRIAAGDLERFVVEHVRAIGRDPKVLQATIEADQREREARKPELVGEARRLASEKARLDAERRNLVDAVAQGGDAPPVLVARLKDGDGLLADVERRAAEIRAELQALELGAIDPGALREALADLEPIWAELFPRERARVLALLLERVEFDAAREEVAITFRPGGPRALRNGKDSR